MAWEWVAPVVTGVVGVAGLAATYATGKQARISAAEQASAQRHEAREQRTHDDKRAAYLGMLEAASEAVAGIDTLVKLSQRPQPDAEFRDDVFRENMVRLSRARDHLRLVAPESVRAAALDLQRGLGHALQTAHLPLDKRVKFDKELNSRLLASMKLDLGYELADSDLASLKTVEVDELAAAEADSLRTEEAE